MLCFIEEVREIQPAAETKQDFSWSVDRNETFVLFYDGQKVLTSSGLFYYNHCSTSQSDIADVIQLLHLISQTLQRTT